MGYNSPNTKYLMSSYISNERAKIMKSICDSTLWFQNFLVAGFVVLGGHNDVLVLNLDLRFPPLWYESNYKSNVQSDSILYS